MDGVSERDDRAVFSTRIALVDWLEECASHCLPVAAADPRVALGAAGGRGRGKSWMGGHCGCASRRVPRAASRAGLDDGYVGLGRYGSMEATVAPSRAALPQIHSVGGSDSFT